MANIGSATLLIVPKFDGLQATINKSLSSVNTTSSGQKMGQQVSQGVTRGMSGLAGAGALMGVFSSITTRALDTIGSHVGSATARLDTLKNYPTVMESLGVASNEAQASIQTMSDRLSSLPTRLDTMASTVQGIYAATKDFGTSLGTATEAGLALNDMMLAGGQGQQVVNSAMEQFRQMLSKGKPDMQDWRSLISAAPGQMDQLAKSMLGPTANANDLYAALGGGKSQAILSMSDLLDAMIRLDKEGGNGLASLQDQAEQASGGIQTAMDNAGNAITKGLANVFDSIGRERIVGWINDVKGAINEGFDDVNTIIPDLNPKLDAIWSDIKSGAGQVKAVWSDVVSSVSSVLPSFDGIRGAIKAVSGDLIALSPAIVAIAGASKGISLLKTGFGDLSTVLGSMSGVAKGASGVLLDLATATSGKLSEGLLSAAGGAETFASVLAGPWGLAIAAGAAGVALLVGHLLQVKQQTDAARKASESLQDAFTRAEGLSTYSGTLDQVSQKTRDCTVDIDGYTQKMQGYADKVNEVNQSTQSQIGMLTTAQQIIDGSIGQTDLNAEAQGRLKWALSYVNDQLGTNISQEDVLTGTYTDQNGAVQTLRDSLDQLIEKRKEEVREKAIESQLESAYQARSTSADAMASAQNAYNDEYNSAYDKYYDLYKLNAQSSGQGFDKTKADSYAKRMAEEAAKASDAGKQLESASKDYDTASKSIEGLNNQLGLSAEVASGTASEYQKLIDASDKWKATLNKNGVSDIDGFAASLESLGVSTDELAGLSQKDMTDIATAYDGTSASIVGALENVKDGAGVAMDAAKQKLAELEVSFADTLGETPAKLSDALQNAGMSMDDFAQKMSDAGLSAQSLAGMSADSFATMAASCGGSVDTMVSRIQALNSLGIDPKTVTVNDDGTITTAEGAIINLDQMTISSKNFSVSDDGTVTDETGKVIGLNGHLFELPGLTVTTVTDNGSATSSSVNVQDLHNKIDLLPKHTPVSVSASVSGQEKVSSLLGTLQSIVAHPWQAVVSAVNGGKGNAAGGIRLNATGGIRPHADGAIATKAVPLDIVGEAGAEAIVPLTNRRYSQPFADIIAEGVSQRLGSGGSTTNVYIDGARVNDDAAIQSAFMALMGELARIKDMG